MDRRRFLTRTAGTGAALLAVGLETACAPPPAAPSGGPSGPVTGFAVGQKAPAIVGPDQYGRATALSDFLGRWVLLDICPLWCGPCLQAAVKHAEFRDYINAHGIAFDVLPIVIDTTTQHQPSVRGDAEIWSYRFHLAPSPVLHCDGNANSPLRNLVVQFTAANNDVEPGFPTSILIDPEGIIRLYHRGTDMNAPQAKIAELTGVALTKTWTVSNTIPSSPGAGATGAVITETTATAAFLGEWQGSPASAAVPDLPLPGFNSIVAPWVQDPENPPTTFPALDPDVPVTVTFHDGPMPPLGAPFRRTAHFFGSVGFLDNDSWTGDVPDLSQLLTGTGTLTEVADGVEMTAPTITEVLGGAPAGGRTWPTMYFNAPSDGTRWTMAYSGAEALIPIVASSGLAPSVIQAASSHLQSVLAHLGQRNFAGAASAAQSAFNVLPPAGTDLTTRALRLDTEWLTQHLNDLATAA